MQQPILFSNNGIQTGLDTTHDYKLFSKKYVPVLTTECKMIQTGEKGLKIQYIEIIEENLNDDHYQKNDNTITRDNKQPQQQQIMLQSQQNTIQTQQTKSNQEKAPNTIQKFFKKFKLKQELDGKELNVENKNQPKQNNYSTTNDESVQEIKSSDQLIQPSQFKKGTHQKQTSQDNFNQVHYGSIQHINQASSFSQQQNHNNNDNNVYSRQQQEYQNFSQQNISNSQQSSSDQYKNLSNSNQFTLQPSSNSQSQRVSMMQMQQSQQYYPQQQLRNVQRYQPTQNQQNAQFQQQLQPQMQQMNFNAFNNQQQNNQNYINDGFQLIESPEQFQILNIYEDDDNNVSLNNQDSSTAFKENFIQQKVFSYQPTANIIDQDDDKYFFEYFEEVDSVSGPNTNNTQQNQIQQQQPKKQFTNLKQDIEQFMLHELQQYFQCTFNNIKEAVHYFKKNNYENRSKVRINYKQHVQQFNVTESQFYSAFETMCNKYLDKFSNDELDVIKQQIKHFYNQCLQQGCEELKQLNQITKQNLQSHFQFSEMYNMDIKQLNNFILFQLKQLNKQNLNLK